MNERLQLITKMAANYPHANVTKLMLTTYLQHTEHIPVDELEQVLDQCIADCKFLPTIAEIIERWRDLNTSLSYPTAHQAWAEVERQIRSVGHTGRPKFDNPIIAELITPGRWYDLCRSTMPDADRREFERAYNELAAKYNRWNELTPGFKQMAMERQPGLRKLDATVKGLLTEWKVAKDDRDGAKKAVGEQFGHSGSE